MNIDKKMNLVVPVYQDDGTTTYVHSMPISREVFEKYFLVLSKTFSAMHAEGLGFLAGPRVASLLLRQIATDMGAWDGEAGVKRGLVGEMIRLTNVIAPGGIIPMQEAVDQKVFSPDDLSEVENAITFFTVVCSMHRKNVLASILEQVAKLWGGQCTLFNCTDFAASLRTSTVTEDSTKKAASSVPY